MALAGLELTVLPSIWGCRFEPPSLTESSSNVDCLRNSEEMPFCLASVSPLNKKSMGKNIVESSNIGHLVSTCLQHTFDAGFPSVCWDNH